MRRILKQVLQALGAMSACLRQGTSKAARFSGIYDSRAAALAALPKSARKGYNDADIANVSFDWMCQRAAFDYPLLYWLKELSSEGTTILDAGGHLGTKYIAFSDVWDLSGINWVVYDTPGIVSAAKARQDAGQLPKVLTFIDTIADAPESDILLASGLVQYLDASLPDFLQQLAKQPQHILLNKVPLWNAAPLYTLERIGNARVPYHIRSETAWLTEIEKTGYAIADRWDIEGLNHTIATHPWLGQTRSKGYLLKRIES